MIDAAQRAHIRRLFFAEHWRIGTIASELGVHHDTVRLAVEVERFANTGTQIRSTLLDPYKALVGKILDDHPKLRATRIFEMIRARGYPGSVVQVRRYIRGVRPSAREAFLRLETMPGEQAQVDWGHFGKIQVGSAKRAVVLRPRAVVVARDLRQVRARPDARELPAWSRPRVRRARRVPREILYDNLKSASAKIVATKCSATLSHVTAADLSEPPEPPEPPEPAPLVAVLEDEAQAPWSPAPAPTRIHRVEPASP